MEVFKCLVYNHQYMIRKVIKFFDKVEDKIRGKLSHYPIVYAFIGGVGIVLFWRGVWHLADDASLNNFISFLAGSIILLITGVFVSSFIGDRLIISGLIGEKKLEEESKEEIDTEEVQIRNLQNTLSRLEKKLDHIDEDNHNHKS